MFFLWDGSHWTVVSKRGTWYDWYFNRITLVAVVRDETGAKMESGAQCKVSVHEVWTRVMVIETWCQVLRLQICFEDGAERTCRLTACGMWGRKSQGWSLIRGLEQMGIWRYYLQKWEKRRIGEKDWDVMVDIVLGVFYWDVSWIVKWGCWIGSLGKRSQVKRETWKPCVL